MKKLSEITEVVEHNENCVILKVTGTFDELIALGGFLGDEKLIRISMPVTLDNNCYKTCYTLWHGADMVPYSWQSGDIMYNNKIMGDHIMKCVSEDFGIHEVDWTWGMRL